MSDPGQIRPARASVVEGAVCVQSYRGITQFRGFR